MYVYKDQQAVFFPFFFLRSEGVRSGIHGTVVETGQPWQAKEDLTTKVEENRRAPLPCATRSVRATGGLSSEQSGRRKRKGAYDAPFLLPIRESVSRFHSIPGGCEDLVIIPSQLQNAIRVVSPG